MGEVVGREAADVEEEAAGVEVGLEAACVSVALDGLEAAGVENEGGHGDNGRKAAWALGVRNVGASGIGVLDSMPCAPVAKLGADEPQQECAPAGHVRCSHAGTGSVGRLAPAGQ